MRPTPPLQDLHYGLIGPGRVGASLASWISHGGGQLASWVRRSEADAGRPFRPQDRGSLEEISRLPLDLLLVCVPDWEIAAVANALGPARAKVALHVSGSLTGESLAPLRGPLPDCPALGSLHPLWAFARVEDTPPQGLTVGIDGDPQALIMARRLADAFGAVALAIPAEARLIYHLAATLAAGGVATVAASAAALARAAGLPEALGDGLRTLATSALTGLSSPRLDRGFTGPVARGDAALVHAEWSELARFPAFDPLVRELAMALIRRLEETQNLNPGHQAIRRFS